MLLSIPLLFGQEIITLTLMLMLIKHLSIYGSIKISVKEKMTQILEILNNSNRKNI